MTGGKKGERWGGGGADTPALVQSAGRGKDLTLRRGRVSLPPPTLPPSFPRPVSRLSRTPFLHEGPGALPLASPPRGCMARGWSGWGQSPPPPPPRPYGSRTERGSPSPSIPRRPRCRGAGDGRGGSPAVRVSGPQQCPPLLSLLFPFPSLPLLSLPFPSPARRPPPPPRRREGLGRGRRARGWRGWGMTDAGKVSARIVSTRPYRNEAAICEL